MIKLTKLDGEKVLINADEIELVEFNFDSTIRFRSGSKILVKEKPEEIKQLVVNFKKECFNGLASLGF